MTKTTGYVVKLLGTGKYMIFMDGRSTGRERFNTRADADAYIPTLVREASPDPRTEGQIALDELRESQREERPDEDARWEDMREEENRRFEDRGQQITIATPRRRVSFGGRGRKL